jgi:hypothetical protein
MSTQKIDQQIIEQGGFVHTVFFWLKSEATPQDHESFVHHLQDFIRSSEFVKTKHIGSKVTSKRDVVDSSYDYCLIATFDSEAEQVKYQDEPVHHDFIKNASHLWEKVEVFDSQSML